MKHFDHEEQNKFEPVSSAAMALEVVKNMFWWTLMLGSAYYLSTHAWR